MIDWFSIHETELSIFVCLNWLLASISALIFFWTFHNKKFLFVKPSILLLAFTHVFFQWPLTLYAGYYEFFLPQPYILLMLVHGFVLLGLAICSYTFIPKAIQIWNIVSTNNEIIGDVDERALIKSLYLLLSLLFLCLIIYLSYVPFSKTGLYHILSTNEIADMARENALKLLGSSVPKYAFSFMQATIIPIIMSFLVILGKKAFYEKKWLKIVNYLIIFLGSCIAVSLVGTRSAIVYLLIILFLTLGWENRLQFTFRKILISLSVILLPYVFLILFRASYNENFMSEGVFLQLSAALKRTLLTPFDVGTWYVHYAQTVKEFGVVAFPKVCYLCGVDAINVPNYIGKTYIEGPELESVAAGAGFLLTYYGYLGKYSFPIALIILVILDTTLLIYIKLQRFLLVPCIAVISFCTLLLTQSEFTTVLITWGYIPVLLTILLLHTIAKKFFFSDCVNENKCLR